MPKLKSKLRSRPTNNSNMISFRAPPDVISTIDNASRRVKKPRADVIRHAVRTSFKADGSLAASKR